MNTFAKRHSRSHKVHARLEVGKGGLPPLFQIEYMLGKSGGKPPFPTSNLAWSLQCPKLDFAKASKAYRTVCQGRDFRDRQDASVSDSTSYLINVNLMATVADRDFTKE